MENKTELVFRDLKAEEIEIRIAEYGEKGVSLLLYKNARVDMDILDETVGVMNWKREHSRDNANCTVYIWDKEKKEWVGKEDTGAIGTGSGKAEIIDKGIASDSFKRACVNWGIGRELYTSPFIFVAKGNFKETTNKSGKETTYDNFIVSKIEVKNKKIVDLEITNENLNRVVFKMGKFIKAPEETKAPKEYPKNITHPPVYQDKTEYISEIINNYDLSRVAELMQIEESKIVERMLGKQSLDYVKKLARKLYLESKGEENE